MRDAEIAAWLRVAPSYVADFAKSLDAPEADAVFLSCGALRALDIVETVEREIDKPVLCSNQASFWHCLRLAVIHEEDRPDAQAYVDRFLEETGWQPAETVLVAGALLYTQYNFFKRQIMKLILRHGGGQTDAGRDYEFTDLDALAAFVDSFVEKIEP